MSNGIKTKTKKTQVDDTINYKEKPKVAKHKLAKHKEKHEVKGDDTIIQCCSDIVLPIAVILGLYIILHGHLTPGGGFQGGVLVGGAASIMYIAYGRKGINEIFNLYRFKISESIGALGFILIASLGLIYGIKGFAFFQNVANKGTPGTILSSGNIFLMNFAVGYKVLAGIGVMILIMLGTLKSNED